MQVSRTNTEYASGSLRVYLADLSKSHPLSSQEEADLAIRIRVGDLDAREKLVHANLFF